jgi:3-oxoacyl-[acyl-carrier protein] reductase
LKTDQPWKNCLIIERRFANMFLENQVAVVTGGARGIGRAIAMTLAAHGANVVISDVNMEAAQKTADDIATTTGRRSLAVTVDVSQSDSVENMVKQTLDAFGHIDILINNAGITRDGLLMRMKDSDWDLVMEINLKGTFLSTKAVLRPMMKQRSGRIINISSVVGIMGNAGQANYAASKAGVIGLTKSTAKEVASRGITVNAVAPGFIATDMTDKLSDDVKANFLASIPLGRAGSAEDVAQTVLFLASPQASYITGQVIHIDGGMVM